MPYEINFIPAENKLNPETVFQSKEEIAGFVIKNIPGYTEAQLSEPVGVEQATLSQFLEIANNGSEWTDPHGFKINITENKFRILMNDENKKNSNEFLSNTAFQNFSSGFETYQKLLQSPDINKNEVMQNMHNLYKRVDEKEKSEKVKELRELIEFVIASCENNTFDKKEFAKKLSNLSISEDFKQEWNKKAGDTSGDLIMLNNVLAFKIEKDGNISLHTRPNNTKANGIFPNIRSGIEKLVQEIKNGNIKGGNIVMKSWLLNNDYGAIMERFFGKKLDFKNVSDEDEDVLPAQYLALQYNSKELEKYLKTGKKPEVKKIELTQEEIFDKFGGSNAY